MIRVDCQCGGRFKASEADSGRQAKCPECGGALVIPPASARDTSSLRDANLETLHGARDVAPQTSALRPKQKFGRYEIRKQLGAGGMGQVWLARDRALKRDVAIKVLSSLLCQNQEQLQRFLREAQVQASLNHANVVQIYEIGSHQKTAFLAMERIDGGSLEDAVRNNGPMSWQDATHAIRDAAAGLKEAHEHGLVHRDIKPANLLRNSKGVTKVGDFGLARAGTQQTQLTQQGAVLGTPVYMAPEQFQGKQVDARSDLYSLICTYYFLLTGKPPFDGPDPVVLCYQHLEQPIPADELANIRIPASILEILRKGASKRANERYQSAGELITALDKVLQDPESTPSGAGPQIDIDVSRQSPVYRRTVAGRKRTRNRTYQWIALLAVGLIALSGMVMTIQTDKGTVRIEVSDPQLTVSVDGNQIDVKNLDKPLTLRTGEHTLTAKYQGMEVETKRFSVTRGDNQAVTVEYTPKEEKHRQSSAEADLSGELTVAASEATTRVKTNTPEWLASLSGKSQLPEETELSAAMKTLRDAHRTVLSTGSSEEKQRVVETLLARAQELGPNDIAAKYAAMRLAAELSVETRRYNEAISICDDLDKSFLVKPFQLKAKVLNSVYLTEIPSQSLQYLTCATLRSGFGALAVRDYTGADQLSQIALAGAARSDGAFLNYQARFLKECLQKAQLHKELLGGLEVLPHEIVDPKRANDVGAVLCFVENDWRQGLPLLARGEPTTYRDLANRELAVPTTLGDFRTLGDSWWFLANAAGDEYSEECRHRAKYWYLRALSACPAEELGDLSGQLLPRIDRVPSQPVKIRVHAVGVEGGHHLTISNDGIHTANSHGTRANWINHLELPGTITDCRNTGLTRLLPSTIDFSTAVIDSEWKGRWGSNRQEFFPDRMVLHFGHGPAGACDFDITISVESAGFTIPNRLMGLWNVKYFQWDPSQPLDADGWKKLTSGVPVVERKQNRIEINMCQQPYSHHDPPPSEKLKRDFFALQASTEWDLPQGEYAIRTRSDDGIRVFIDGDLYIDNWTTHGAQDDVANIELPAGRHFILVEYFQYDKEARLLFSLRRISQ